MGAKLIKKFIFMFFILFLFVNLVNAMPLVDIKVKSTFYEGDVINFSYSLLSQQNESIKYSANVDCEGSPEVLLEIQEINLKENELFFGEYFYGVVNEDMKSGNCFASILILEPYEAEFAESFKVITLPAFDFTPLFCKDSLCTEKSKVFIQGEEIYLDYLSDITNPFIEATLILPDDKAESITIPTSMNAEQIGTYNLEIIVSKEGYRDISLSEQFGVIEGDADISYVDSKEFDSLAKSNLIYYLIGGIILLILLIIFALIIIKRRKVNMSTQKSNS